jgi:hypothetical protein
MSDWQLRTPVAFLVFNRPETTRQVFAEIARARPPALLVVADGPRESRADEAEKCARVRAVIDQVDWPCDVATNYSGSNLGCRDRVSSGLDWVFEQVPEAIILEDDCLPHPTFFRYCDDLLERYREDPRVGMISGDNFQFGRKVGDGSYYFSKYTHIWGWASWRRAWKHYDVKARIWPEFLDSGWFDQMTFACERRTWRWVFERIHSGLIDTWDYQWTLACWSQSMMTVMPQANLVSNIGFGAGATHTQDHHAYANLQSAAMTWPLREPRLGVTNACADRRTAEQMFSMPPLHRRVANRVRRLVGR